MRRGTILVVEDEIGDKLVDLLQRRSYEVKLAINVKEAREILKNVWVNWIVVDLSLVPGVQDNNDGLLILKDEEYRLIPKILITQYARDTPLVRDVLRPRPGGPWAVDYIQKGADKDLFEQLDNSLKAHDNIDRDLVIRWSTLR